MMHWPAAELLASASDERFYRIVVKEPRLRSGAISFAPGDRVKEHMHPDSDEIFFVLSGSGRLVIEGEILDAGPGDLIYVGAGERHAIAIADTAPAPFVLIAAVAPNLGDDAVFSPDPFPFPLPE